MKKLPFIVFSMIALLVMAGCQHVGIGTKSKGEPAFGIISLDNTTAGAAKRLSDAFLQQGEAQDVVIYKGMSDKAQYYIKGYFSVVADDKPDENMVLYVFDVVDKNGSRLHRVQGKYVLGRLLAPHNADFWSSLNKDGYDTIAAQAINALKIWAKKQ